ncbi:MAG: ABC transporter permease [Pseudomonadota bacterium]
MSVKDGRYIGKSRPSFQWLRVLFAMIMREMNTRYGRSFGGYAWAILEPVGFIAILSVAFGLMIRTPALGSSFVLFYASGYIPFHYFIETSNNVGGALQLNRPLMQYPSVTPIDAILARFTLSLFTLFIVSILIFAGVFILAGPPQVLTAEYLLMSFGLGALLGIGVGSVNVVLFAFFPVWRQLWMIITRPLFILSGIFYTFESMPEVIRSILWYNPLIHVVGYARKGMYPFYDGAYLVWAYPALLGGGLLVLGLYLCRRHKSYIIEAK